MNPFRSAFSAGAFPHANSCRYTVRHYGQRQLQRSFALLLNPSHHLMEVSSLRFSLFLLFHTSSFQAVIIRFRWCVDAKICGMFVCEIKPIVWRIFLEISAKTMDSMPYRNYVYCYYPYVCLKVENHPALLTVSSMVFLSPRSTNTTEEQPDGKNVQLPYGNTAQRASGDFARHLLANFPSYFTKMLVNTSSIHSAFCFI